MDNDLSSEEATTRERHSNRVGSLRDIIHRARGSKTSGQLESDMDSGRLYGMEAVALQLRPTRRCTLPVSSSETQERIEMWLNGFETELKETIEDKEHAKVEEYLKLLVRMHPELTSISNRRWFSRTASTPKRRSLRTPRKMDEGAWEMFFAEMECWIRRLEEIIAAQSVADHCLLWERARLTFLRKIVVDTLTSLHCSDDALYPSETFTGGVSYVKRSESHQYNVCDEYAPLPPLVIQPPNLKKLTSEIIVEMIETIKTKDVLLARMPDRDDAMIKSYLLNDIDRREAVRATAGASCQMIQGLQGICPMFGDHVFLCCHYRLDDEGHLHPCTETKKGSKLGVDGSNVQLVIIVRKGIGGTWALRNAAKCLDEVQMLPLMMGTCSLMDIDFGTDIQSLGSLPRKKPCISPIDPFCLASPSSDASIRSVSVKTRAQTTPPVCESTMTDWFTSVQNTARELLESASRSSHGSKTPMKTTEMETPKRSGSHRSVNVEENYSKATSTFMQKTLKRRLTTCKSNTPANIKIHTLSCRLELFVSEDLWKSLDTDVLNALHSTVIGVEEWLRGQLQKWNKERLMVYCEELISSLDIRLKEASMQMPVPRPKHVPVRSLSMHAPVVKDTSEDPIEDVLNEVLQDIPEFPNDVEDIAGSTIKATAVAANVPISSQPEIPWPFYLIGTRDCFTYDLIEVKRQITKEDRAYVRTDFYFHDGQVPEDYGMQRNPGSVPITDTDPPSEPLFLESTGDDWEAVDGYPSEPPVGARPVGVTTYTSLFTHEELKNIESKADSVHDGSKLGIYPRECYHPTIGKNGALRRTKYFFGARYLWTKEQLAKPDSHIAKGVRVDVPPNPIWMKESVEMPLVSTGIVDAGFINSWALNMYHDGSEGIQSHFDDSQRFCQPIYSMRLFSDSRLSFGTQLYGFTNGAFCVPMPRGCITVMHDRSYAANAIKHCVRPCDMTGKSAGLIMRKINKEAWDEAMAYHMSQTIDWFQNCSLDDTPRAHRTQSDDLNRGQDTKDPMGGMDRRLENASEKQLHVAECKAVMGTMVKELECTEKQAQKQRKQLQHEETAVSSVMKNLIKKVERNVIPPKRKRKDSPGISSNQKTESDQPFFSNESFIITASQVTSSLHHQSEWLLKILEKIMGRRDCQFLHKVSSLLKKCGNEWIQALCVVREHDAAALNDASVDPSLNVIDSLQASNDHPTSDASPQGSTTIDGLKPITGDPMPLGGDQKITLNAAVPPPEQPVNDNVDASQDGMHRVRSKTHPDTSITPQLPETSRPVSAEALLNGTRIVKNTEPKALLSSLLEVALKEAALTHPESNVDCLHASSLHLSEDILKRVMQETEAVDFGSMIHDQPSPVTPPQRHRSSKRKYRLTPWDVCFSCERPGYDPRSVSGTSSDDALWLCRGPCRRWFHVRCVEPSVYVKCAECTTGQHRCHLCGEGSNHLGPILKCTHGVCGRHYHVQCVMQIKETKVLHMVWKPVGSVSSDTSCMKFKCPQHYCKSCGKSGANKSSVTCIRCPTAYHTRCRPSTCVQLSKKVIICPRHLNSRSGE